MNRTEQSTAAPPRPVPLGRIARERIWIEIVSFARSKVAVIFSVLFPVALLLLFGAIFGNERVQGVRYAQVLTAGILASAVASASFLSTTISVAVERAEGRLKRIFISPMPRAAYFMGKIGLVAATTVVGMILTLAAGVLFFDVSLPSSAGRWLTLLWVTVLGAIACTLGGIALSSLIGSARQAGPIANLPFVALNFLSGVYVSFWDLPKGLQIVGSLFPLKWMAQGYRSVLLPDSFVVQEVAKSWEHDRTFGVLLAWCVGGSLLCVKTFRWMPKQR